MPARRISSTTANRCPAGSTAALVFALAGLFLASCGREESGAGEASGRQRADAGDAGVFQSTCAVCHGARGQGSKETMAPAIAAMPRWYLEEQLKKFRNGQRGAHPDDAGGGQMRSAVAPLTAEQISEALDTVENLPPPALQPTLEGDAGNGSRLYREHCVECHRFNGRGERAFLSSPVAGLQDWYLLGQWRKFKRGVRGYHEDDASGEKMRRATGYLANEREIRDVIRYMTTLPGES